MPRPRELCDLVTQRPEAVAPKCNEGATKSLRVTKSLSSCRSQHLTYLEEETMVTPSNAILGVQKLVKSISQAKSFQNFFSN